MSPLPKIRIVDGVVTAGAFTLEPSRKDYRKKRAFWRARLDGKVMSGWTFSPRLAIAQAIRKTAAL